MGFDIEDNARVIHVHVHVNLKEGGASIYARRLGKNIEFQFQKMCMHASVQKDSALQWED